MTTYLGKDKASISTGNGEIDKKVGGGIPVGSLTLIEGQSDAGKSVLCQHFAYGAIEAGLGVVYYTAENTVKSLLSQMSSLSLEITDHFLVDQCRIYPFQVSGKTQDAEETLAMMSQHMATLPEDYTVLIMDSLTNAITHSGETAILDFFSSCKLLCDSGKTIFMVVHSYAFDEKLLIRVRSLCDAHMRLRLEEIGERLIKVMEVSKVRNAERLTGNIISFDVEPGLGMRVIPISKAKA